MGVVVTSEGGYHAYFVTHVFSCIRRERVRFHLGGNTSPLLFRLRSRKFVYLCLSLFICLFICVCLSVFLSFPPSGRNGFENFLLRPRLPEIS